MTSDESPGRPIRADLDDAQTEQLFPLPLTAFELYTLLDGETSAGMTFTLLIDVEGAVDREAFEAAVAFASARQPLCRATIITRGWRKYWSLTENRWPTIVWTDGENFPAAWHQPLDLAREPGLAVLVQQGDGRARILGRFHHACTDGVGAAQWLDDVMVRYATLTSEKHLAPELNEILPQRLTDRRRNRWPRSFSLQWICQSIGNFYKHLCQLPRPLAAPLGTRSSDRAPCDLVVHSFSVEETAGLRRLAEQKQVSLNAWLLSNLFRTIAIWNQPDEDRTSGNPWYRICMPISLRERADSATPATNLTGLTFLQRRSADLLGDRDELLHGVEQECREIKRSRRGTLFLQNLDLVCAVPGLLRLLLGRRVCYATMTLTNLGDPSRRLKTQFAQHDGKLVFGNLAVTYFGGAPPLTRYLHGTLSVNTYRDRLTLNLYMSPQRFSHADAERFLQIYVSELRSPLEPAAGLRSLSLATPG